MCRPLSAAIWNRKKSEMIVVLLISTVSLALNLLFTVGAKMIPVGEVSQDINVTNVTDVQGTISRTLVGRSETNSSSATGI